MTRREDLGSWLEGTPGEDGREAASGIGLPSTGEGSVAPVGRRIAALAVDWVLALAVSAAFFPDDRPALLWLLSGDQTATLGVFAASTVVLVALLGHTIGHRCLGIGVIRLRDVVDGSPPRLGAVGPVAAVVRTALLCLVVPAVIWDRHGRGLHDVAARTVIVRR